MPAITAAELENASVDAASISVFVNGGVTETHTSRLGATYPTIAKIANDAAVSFASQQAGFATDHSTTQAAFQSAINDLVGTQTADYDVRVVGYFDDVQNLTIPGNVQLIFCMGRTSPFDKGWIWLERYTSQPYMPDRFRTTSNGGTVHWGILPVGPIRASQAGAIGGLVQDASPIVQDCIALIDKHNPEPLTEKFAQQLHLDRNQFLFTEGIMVGWGDSFAQYRVFGNGKMYRDGVATMSGSTYIYYTGTDAPCFSLNALRHSYVRGCYIEGAYNDAVNNLIAAGSGAGLYADRRALHEIATWNAITGSSRYGPYAGVAIDPYLNDHIFRFDGGEDTITTTGTHTVDFTELVEAGQNLTVSNVRYNRSGVDYDFSGTYTVVSVTASTITLANPNAVNSDWGLFETNNAIPTAPIYAKLVGNLSSYHGGGIGDHYAERTTPQYIIDALGYAFNVHRDQVGGSSACQVEDMGIAGFDVAGVSQPGNADRNADFTKFNDLLVENCKVLLSVGNSQSRDLGLNNINYNRVHTVITNNMHGRQRGQFGGEMVDVSGGGYVAQLFDINTSSFFKTGVFRNWFCESLMRLGDFAGGTSNERRIIFDECVFNMDHDPEEWGIPSNIGTFGGNEVQFNGGEITGTFDSLHAILECKIEFNGTFIGTKRVSGTLERWLAAANNAVAGVMLDLVHRPMKQDLIYKKWNATTGAFRSTVSMLSDITTDRNSGVPHWQVETRRPTSSTTHPPEYNTPRLINRQTQNAAHFAGFVRRTDSLDWDITLAGIGDRDEQATRNFMTPGDVCTATNEGTTWFIRFRSGFGLVLEQQNNYILDDSDVPQMFNAAIDDIRTDAGSPVDQSVRFLTGRHFLLKEKVFGTHVAGSASNIVTNLTSRTNASTFMNTALAVGDYVASDQHGFFGNWPVYEGPDGEITALAGASGQAGTFTISDDPIYATPGDIMEFDWFLRALDIPNGAA